MNDKLRPNHLSRKAVLYIRQSSLSQVLRNEESWRLQYGMRQRLVELGWIEIEIVDEDLGKSAAGATERSGFERMVAEVCLGKVGAVAAREVSRFARNSKEWQQLVEVCRVVDTVLIDHETIYDPRRGNDRLLLGLKGSLNEYELDILRLRSVEARHQKARRGELIITAPVGYLKTADGRLEKDPDLRVQEALKLVFRKTLELGAARQTLLWLIEHQIQLPATHPGPLGWETIWRRPTYPMIQRLLQNPVYAGYYAYGKTEARLEYRDGKALKRIRRKAQAEWLALIPNRYESYIDEDSFRRIQELLVKNAQQFHNAAPGAPKRGPALLCGLLRCRRCGRKLGTRYTGRDHGVGRYVCCRGLLDQAEPRCISLGAQDADIAIAKEVLRVVQPAAIEAAKAAMEQSASRHDAALRALQLELQAAQYTAEKNRRQYDAADPANRLVTAELERRWNAAMQTVRALESRIAEASAASNAECQQYTEPLGQLATDLQRVWDDQHTDVRLKKRLLRTLLEEIVVDVDLAAAVTELVLHWKGGIHTTLRLQRRLRGQTHHSAGIEVVEAVRQLSNICPDKTIAGYLNRNGLRTGYGNRWTQERVTSLRNKQQIPNYSDERRNAEGWLSLTDAANHLDLCELTLRVAAEKHQVPAMHPLAEGPWIFRRADLAQPGVRALVERVNQWRKGVRKRKDKTLSLFSAGTSPEGAV